MNTELLYKSGRLSMFVALLMVGFWTGVVAQEPEQPAIPEPDTADVESIDAILTAVYDVISGPASEERDWDRLLSLFVPGARLMPTAMTPDGEIVVRVMSPLDYSERAADFFRRPGGFFEKEIGRKTEIYGNIAHAFSAYASFREGEDEPFMRGINSFQLLHQKDGWRIVSIFWDSERPDNPIPEEYLYDSE